MPTRWQAIVGGKDAMIVSPSKLKSVSASPIPDRAAIVKTFQMIVGDGQVTELRALDAVVDGDRYPGVYAGYFDDAQAFADAAMSIKSAKGIYFIPNPVNPALLARACNHIRRAPKGESTTDKDIVRRRWLLIDLDAIRPSGISASEAEHHAAYLKTQEVYQYLHDEFGFGDPIEADSGNGWHLLYPIDDPADDGGAVQNMLLHLKSKFDDEFVKVDGSVHNASRIWKLYGTVAGKGDHIADRPHRLARITNAPRELNGGASWL